jgi:ABC-type multidrug transport system fused ATPase/permease subunit
LHLKKEEGNADRSLPKFIAGANVRITLIIFQIILHLIAYFNFDIAMLLFLFYFFLAYLFYRLVFHFILPVYRTTRRVKKSFREMHEKMNEQYGGTNTENRDAAATHQSNAKAGDYIDFEEVKD